MKIDYSQILKNNMINVLKDVLKIIDKKGLKEGHHLFITFKTNYPNVQIPKLLKDKDYLFNVLEKGAKKANLIAKDNIKEIYNIIGLTKFS